MKRFKNSQLLSMKNNANEVVCFGLTRGYPKLASKWRYLFIVTTNLSIKAQEARLGQRWSKLIFHEGNISRLDQSLIQFLSLMRIEFVDVSETFAKPQHMSHSGSVAPLGYSLMCRFQYFGLWKYLEGYKIGIRVDEDCILTSVPDPRFLKGFLAPALTLDSILRDVDAPQRVNFFSLDVEGAELEVLKGVPHNDYRFSYLLVESRNFEGLAEFLERQGYEFIDALTSHDFLFRGQSLKVNS